MAAAPMSSAISTAVCATAASKLSVVVAFRRAVQPAWSNSGSMSQATLAITVTACTG